VGGTGVPGFQRFKPSPLTMPKGHANYGNAGESKKKGKRGRASELFSAVSQGRKGGGKSGGNGSRILPP